MTASHSASVMLTIIRSRRMPALLTTTSRVPNVSIACWTSLFGAVPVGDVVGVRDGLAAGALISLTTCWAGPVAGPAVAVAPDVVDDDLGAVLGEQQRVLGRCRHRHP